MEQILIIDDDVALCDLVAEYLQPLGFSVEAVHQGNTGVERALAGGHSLVVLDVMLPLRCGPIDEPGREQLAVITVRDHGAGVPDEALSRIFQPFYRVADARDRESGGAGLGLAIAERSVKLHGGTVIATNAIDGGLVVTISLPALA